MPNNVYSKTNIKVYCNLKTFEIPQILDELWSHPR